MDKNISSLITIFGGTGDLSYRKLYPAIFNLYKRDHFNKLIIIATGLEDLTNEKFRDNVKKIISSEKDDGNINEFLSYLYYQKQNVQDEKDWLALKKLCDKLDENYNLQGNRLFYLAMYPGFFEVVTQNIKECGLSESTGFTRIIIEKPFGHDLESAKKLNSHINKYFTENEIFRIDHYLGKEMVQNIEAIRFGNTIFEPIWNREFISNIQITLSETLGVEKRSAYYDKTGALKDMVQNHLLQILTLIAMEKPDSRKSIDIRNKKIELLKSLKPLNEEEVDKNFIRGQYEAGQSKNQIFKAYSDENGVTPNSTTETFVAGKVLVENKRWDGVPFYIRTGKRMNSKETKIVIEFKNKDNMLNYLHDNNSISNNIMVISIEPCESISLYIYQNKSYRNDKPHTIPLKGTNDHKKTVAPYENLICDALVGDHTNFIHWEELKYSWIFIDMIKKGWLKSQSEIYKYPSGSFGPEESNELLQSNHSFWWNDL